MTTFAAVPRLWPGETVVCAGTGPSLTADDLEFCRGQARVIAISDAYKLAPWADCLYSCDDRWWKWHQGAPDFAGMKYRLAPARKEWPGVQAVRNAGLDGLETDPTGVRTGKVSGYQAINMAVHFGARRIVLLGYDMKGKHFFGSHPDGSVPPFHLAKDTFPTLVAPLKALGVRIVNCTPGTALHAFPKARLQDVFPSALSEAC